MWVIRPVASLVQREVQSRLEAFHAEAIQQPRKCVKCGKLFWPLFSVIGMSSHGKFMLCTALLRSNNHLFFKPGLGPDLNKPLCRKTKVVKAEKRVAKLGTCTTAAE